MLDRGEIRRRLDVFVHDWRANIEAWDDKERSRSGEISRPEVLVGADEP